MTQVIPIPHDSYTLPLSCQAENGCWHSLCNSVINNTAPHHPKDRSSVYSGLGNPCIRESYLEVVEIWLHPTASSCGPKDNILLGTVKCIQKVCSGTLYIWSLFSIKSNTRQFLILWLTVHMITEPKKRALLLTCRTSFRLRVKTCQYVLFTCL